MECSICGRDAVYEQKYSGSSLCPAHFSESVEKRVKKELRRQISFPDRKGSIAVAISGGKDSSLTLHMIHRFYSKWKGVRISAFTVDEGIMGYRESGLQSARKLCESLGIPHSTVSFIDAFGTTMDREVAEHPSEIPCSRCGPMRRNLINWSSVSADADYVALGINLDDYAQSVLMNVVKGDTGRMGRMAPHSDAREGMVRRVIPLRMIPEKEVLLYCILHGIEHDQSWCPYSERAQRNYFRNLVNDLEDHFPGSRFAMVNFLDHVKPYLEKSSASEILGECRHCGRPTSGDVCSVCRMMGPQLNTR